MEDEVSESLQKRERKSVHQHRAQPSIHTRTVPRRDFGSYSPKNPSTLEWAVLNFSFSPPVFLLATPPYRCLNTRQSSWYYPLLTSFLASGDLANAVMQYFSYSSLFQASYLGVYKMTGRKSSGPRKTWKWILSFFKIYEHKRGAVSWPLWARWLHPSKGMLVEVSIRSLFCRWRNIFLFFSTYSVLSNLRNPLYLWIYFGCVLSTTDSHLPQWWNEDDYEERIQ